jgi:hypothetical protein
MRTLAVVLVAIAAALTTATPAAAQARGAPNLVLTMYGGASGGHALWTIDRQTLIYGGSTSNPPDTVRLSRNVTSAITAGAMVSLYSSAHVGLNVDVSYRGFGFDDTCAPIALQATPSNNSVLCSNVSASGNTGSVIAVSGGVIVRVAPRGAVTPYARLAASLANTTLSTLAVAAPEAAGGVPRIVVADDDPRRTSFGLALAAGITTPVGTGYQFRLELRDHVAALEQLDGAANALGTAPSSVKLFHHFGLILGLDVVLEQRRGRRY